MARLLVLVILVIPALATAEPYAKEYKDSFMKECLKGASQAICSCVLDELEATVPYNRALVPDDAFIKKVKQLTRACIDEVGLDGMPDTTNDDKKTEPDTISKASMDLWKVQLDLPKDWKDIDLETIRLLSSADGAAIIQLQDTLGKVPVPIEDLGETSAALVDAVKGWASSSLDDGEAYTIKVKSLSEATFGELPGLDSTMELVGSETFLARVIYLRPTPKGSGVIVVATGVEDHGDELEAILKSLH